MLGDSRDFYIGYDIATKTLHVVDATAIGISDVKPFRLDTRNYTKANVLVERLGFDTRKLPMHFDYVGAIVSNGVESQAFTLRDV